ncbi:MAG: hypothetical protein ACKVTZ_15590 [Bacteroidia bacterium]
MKKIFYLAIGLFVSTGAWAQKVTTEPSLFSPTESVKIIVDLTQCERPQLVGNAGPLYIWTWLPKDPPGGNGSWTDSNESLKMTDEGNNKWSFTMTPTNFYQATEDEVYEKDIYFLVKADNGSGGVNGEDKTEDLTLKVDPLTCKKMCSFPQSIVDTVYSTFDQPFSFLYDKTFETKANLSAATEYVVFARLWIEGVAAPVPFIAPAQIMNNHPELEMTLMEGSNSRYQWTIIPSDFFKTKLDEYPGKKLMGVQIRAVVKKTSAPSSSDFTDEMTNFYFIQE